MSEPAEVSVPHDRRRTRSGRGRQVLGVALITLADAAFLGVGITSGWFSSGDLLVGAWAQAAIPLLATPLVLLSAALLAPSDPAVDAGKPMKFNDRPVRGRAAAGITAAFFTVHFGMFTVVLGVFSFILANRAGLGISLAGAGWLLVRAVAANVPGVVADARFIASDGYAQLAARTQAVMGRPYLRMIPLHLGVVVLFGGPWQSTTRQLEWGIVAVVVLMTAVASLWRYPPLGLPADTPEAGPDR